MADEDALPGEDEVRELLALVASIRDPPLDPVARERTAATVERHARALGEHLGLPTAGGKKRLVRDGAHALAIVRRLVETHGGAIRAANERDPQGATFTIVLPVPAVRASNPPRARLDPPDLDGVRILVVDDEEDAGELVARVLRGRGARVTLATDALDALDLIAERPPMILISDVGMPGVDGYELVRRVRARDESLPRFPAIALTAYADADDRRRALAAGFHLHVGKPVDPDDLLEAVVSLLPSVARRAAL